MANALPTAMLNEIDLETAAYPGATAASDRRRPGRPSRVSPTLLALLRKPSDQLDYESSPKTPGWAPAGDPLAQLKAFLIGPLLAAVCGAGSFWLLERALG